MTVAKSYPWMKFYPQDWLGDQQLRACSAAARGLWMDMISLAHKATPYGHVLINGNPPDTALIARLTGLGVTECESLLSELDTNGVFSRTRKGVIYSRRMVRGAKNAAKSLKNGKKGGNPSLCKQRGKSRWVNPPDNPEVNLRGQRLETRSRDSSHNDREEQEESLLHQHHQFSEPREMKTESTGLADPPAGVPPDTARPADAVGSEPPPAERKPDQSTDDAVCHREVARLGGLIAELMGVRDDPRWFGDYARVHAWLKQGFSPDLDIIPAITAVMQRRRHANPPRSLKYFDNAIAEYQHNRTRQVDYDPATAKPTRGFTDNRGSSPHDRLFQNFADVGAMLKARRANSRE